MYIVEKIIGKKINERNQTFYKIKWKGYPENEATWEPVRNVRGVQDMIEEFEIRNRKKMTESMRNHYDRPRMIDQSAERQKYREETVADQPPVRLGNRSEELYENQPRKKLKKMSAEEESQPNITEKISEVSQPRQNIDMQPSQQNQQENDSGEYLLGVDLNELTAKINELASKKKWLRIVSMSKEDDNQFTYEVERQGGRLSRETREYLLSNYQDQLIEFYEKHITFQKSND